MEISISEEQIQENIRLTKKVVVLDIWWETTWKSWVTQYKDVNDCEVLPNHWEFTKQQAIADAKVFRDYKNTNPSLKILVSKNKTNQESREI